ncbi:MAG: hypothetical protein IPL47_13355 [Phyllobacteriaceae bacterium]|nr:hypothetical protein [Phyllobacteriaceae bacterium]
MTMTIRLALAAAIALPALSIAKASVGSDGFSTGPESGSIVEKRPKPRQKGGSGCDDPRDVIEHPECR